jgi:hypothetical protein
VGPWWRHQGRQAGYQIEGLEDGVGGSVAPAVPEAIEDSPVGELGEALGGYGWPSHISTEPLQSAPVACGDTDVGVKAEPAGARAAQAGHLLQIVDADAIAEA